MSLVDNIDMDRISADEGGDEDIAGTDAEGETDEKPNVDSAVVDLTEDSDSLLDFDSDSDDDPVDGDDVFPGIAVPLIPPNDDRDLFSSDSDPEVCRRGPHHPRRGREPGAWSISWRSAAATATTATATTTPSTFWRC